MIDPDSVTLGILAGGRASRLDGVDKAWLVRDGVTQVERIANAFAGQVSAILVSANRDLPRYGRRGLAAVADIHLQAGPIGGIHALAATCTTPWLLTVPVDVVHVDEAVLQRLAEGADKVGVCAADDDGRQPLVALWPVPALRTAVAMAIEQRDLAIHALQARLHMTEVRLAGVRIGNLNTPPDLVAAGIAADRP